MENSPNLSLPYIMPSQAQKHVTHNEALVALDAIIQLAVLDKDVGAPPLSPGEGDRYLVAAGADGIWVSNHGGRQLDGAISSIDALPAIRQAVGNDVPLVIDSGIRTGMDVIKAKARGVSVAAIGRAALFGAAAGGEAGVARVLDILLDEVTLGLTLAGVPRFQQVDSSLLA